MILGSAEMIKYAWMRGQNNADLEQFWALKEEKAFWNRQIDTEWNSLGSYRSHKVTQRRASKRVTHQHDYYDINRFSAENVKYQRFATFDEYLLKYFNTAS